LLNGALSTIASSPVDLRAPAAGRERKRRVPLLRSLSGR
jgi:hypothetical protein